MKNTLLLVATLLIVACSTTPNNKDTTVSSTNKPQNTMFGLTIDSAIVANIANDLQKPFEQFKKQTLTLQADSVEIKHSIDTGIVFHSIEEKKAQNIFLKYIKLVKSSGNYIFLTNLHFKNKKSYYDVVILNTDNPFEIIEKMNTNDEKNTIDNNHIIDKLKEWNNEVKFTFVVIDENRIHAFLNKKPEDIGKFADNVSTVCPKIIHEGYGSIDAMVEDLQFNNYLWMWW